MPGSYGWTPERSAAGDRNPWLIASIVSLAAFMEVLDIAIANVALNHIAGSLAASYDQATWVLTSYLVANAIVIPLSGWLSETIGRKRYYMISVGAFAVTSLLCGLASSLKMLVLFRVLQGIAGGGLQPTTQAMLVDSFPPAKRGAALAMFGLTVILAPTIGPILGGFITDRYSWRWIFLINVPVGALCLFLVEGLVTEPALLVRERKERLRRGLYLDIPGALLIALALGCLEITVDRGERDDWLASVFIRTTAIISVVAMIGFIFRQFLAREPLLQLRIFAYRNFAIACLIICFVGVIAYGTTQFIPQLLQEVLGYTATRAGAALTLGGIATLVSMPIVGILSNRIQPRWLIVFGLVLEVVALYHMTHLNTQISFEQASLARLYQIAGLPFLFIPVTNAAYVGLPASCTNDATAILNVLRNLGGSIGISIIQTLIAHRQQFYQSRYTELLQPLNANFQLGIDQITHALIAQGQSMADAARMAPGVVYQTLQQQVTMLSFLDCFYGLAIAVACMLPFALMLKGSQQHAAPAAAA
jgi:MFS transporter, DHA2 family, multidrug resistance protein